MTDCLESYIKHWPILMTICDREHLSKISKCLNCVKCRKYSVQYKATRISFCHFVNGIAYINIALIPSKTFISEMNLAGKKCDLNQKI